MCGSIDSYVRLVVVVKNSEQFPAGRFTFPPPSLPLLEREKQPVNDINLGTELGLGIV